VVRSVHRLVTQGPGATGIVGAPSLDQASQYIHEIEVAAERSPYMAALIAGGPSKGISRKDGFPQVEFVTGGTMHCRSTVHDGRYLRGKGADWVALTEACFVRENVYQRVIRPLVLDRRGVIYLDTSPNGDDYVKGLFDRALYPVEGSPFVQRSKDGYYRRTHATVYDNPRLTRQDIESIRQEVPDWVFRVEFLAEFLDDQEAVFSWPLLADLFDQDYAPQTRALPGHRYAIGLDLAEMHDYTCITVVDLWRAPYRLAAYRRFRGTPYIGSGGVVDQVLQLREAFGRARVYVDATNEKAVAESIPGAEAVVFTQSSRNAMLSQLLVLCEARNLQLPSAYTVLRDEMRAMRRVRLPSGSIRPDHPRSGYDDTVWSLALACRGIANSRHVGSSNALRVLREAAFYPR
jgi:hypothetical protein